MKRIPVATLLSLLLACAGAPPAPPPRAAVCVQDRAPGGEPPDARAWTSLLLRGVDPVTRRPTTPALDCTGAQVRWDGPALACEDGALARTILPEQPITASDVLVTTLSPTESLAWVITHRFASGDALGPAALVETAGGQLRVIAVGPLRAYPQRARLRLERMGDRPVVVAEGEACAGPDPATCARAARVVPIRGDRLAPQPLLGEDRRCVSPAWFDLLRRDPRKVGGTWERLDLDATMSFDGGRLDVDERVVVQELASAGGVPDRVLRRAQSRRVVRPVGESLVVDGPSLWTRMSGTLPVPPDPPGPRPAR